MFNLQRLAVLTTALARSPPDPDLIYEAMKDRIHQPYRMALVSLQLSQPILFFVFHSAVRPMLFVVAILLRRLDPRPSPDPLHAYTTIPSRSPWHMPLRSWSYHSSPRNPKLRRDCCRDREDLQVTRGRGGLEDFDGRGERELGGGSWREIEIGVRASCVWPSIALCIFASAWHLTRRSTRVAELFDLAFQLFDPSILIRHQPHCLFIPRSNAHSNYLSSVLLIFKL